MKEGGLERKPKKSVALESSEGIPVKSRSKEGPKAAAKPNPIDTLAAKLRATKSQEWNDSLKIIPMTLKKDFAATADADSESDLTGPDAV